MTVTLLLGKPPRPGTLPGAVAERLVERGLAVTVRLPHEEDVRAAELAAESLVVHRGLHPRVAPVLAELHLSGVALCNPWPAERMMRDRSAWSAALRAAGVPVPRSTAVTSWPDVLRAAEAGSVVAKAADGPGRGRSVVAGTAGTLPRSAPFDGPYLVEEHLATEGIDRKLYLAGDQVRGLLKGSTLHTEHSEGGEPFEPDAALLDLAHAAGHALGAHLLGIDAVPTPAGPVVVDVNPFPGFRGVADAAEIVADHLIAHLAGAGAAPDAASSSP